MKLQKPFLCRHGRVSPTWVSRQPSPQKSVAPKKVKKSENVTLPMQVPLHDIPVWGLYITINSQISYLLHDFFLLGISSNIYSQASAKSEPFQRLYPKRSKSKILSRQKALCSMYTLNRPMPVSSHLIEQSCQHQMRRGFHVWNAYAAGESYRAATGSGQH